MSLFFSLLRLSRRFHPRQQFVLGGLAAKGLLLGAMLIMFGVTWGVLAFFRRACSFVVHLKTFLVGHAAIGRLCAAHAPIVHSLQERGA